MKRLCNEQEKYLLYKNRSQILKGILNNTTKVTRFSDIFIGIFVSLFVMIIGFMLIFELFPDNLLTNNKAFIYFFVFTAITFCIKFTSFISQKVRLFLDIDKRKFFKSRQIEINGVTVVDYDKENRIISYVEDDNINDNIIIIDYPAADSDFEDLYIYDRLIIIYTIDKKGRTSYQLMRCSKEVENLIPSISPYNFEGFNAASVLHYPHKNAININPIYHKTSPEEIEKFAEIYKKSRHKTMRKLYFIFSFIEFPLVNALITFVALSEYSIQKAIPYYAALNLILIGLLVVFKILNDINLKKMSIFSTVQEVIFCSANVDYGTSNYVLATISYYQWNGKEFELDVSNDGRIGKCQYGDVLYMLTNKKNATIFIKKPD